MGGSGLSKPKGKPLSKYGLAYRGEACVLTVDPMSDEVVDLYLPDTELWNHLLKRFGGNKMMVTLRAPHDYKRGLRMPPAAIIERIVTWDKEDGTAQGLKEIADEVLDDERRD